MQHPAAMYVAEAACELDGVAQQAPLDLDFGKIATWTDRMTHKDKKVLNQLTKHGGSTSDVTTMLFLDPFFSGNNCARNN